MRKRLAVILAGLLVFSGAGLASQTFIDSTGSTLNEYGGTLTDQGGYQELVTGDGGNTGAYTYGPGKTFLPKGFGTFTQSIDVYIDPANAGNSAFTWTIEVLLRNGAGNAGYGEFDFFGYYQQSDSDLDGDGENDWIYSLGRNGSSTAIDNAGWYTFTTEWTDDGTNLSNNNYITSGSTLLDVGPSVRSPWDSLDGGYETGYMWMFSRSGVVTAGLDNVVYQVPAVPVPGALLLGGIGTALVGGIRRRL